MNEKVKAAEELYKVGYVCSQAVFAAYSELLGLDKNMALKIGNGFGGGIARKQEICGAVTGAIMVIGLKYGKVDAKDSISHEKTYEKVHLYCKEFFERNHSLNCHELLGCDLKTAHERGLFSSLCKKYVTDSAEIVGKILEGSEE